MTTKHDQSKPRFSLIPSGTLNAVIRVLEFGASKYTENNWQTVPDARRRYYDAMQRHIDAWWQGEKKDKETGESHLAHAVCCALFLMWLDENSKDEVNALSIKLGERTILGGEHEPKHESAQEHCKHKFEYLGNDMYRCAFCRCLTSGRGQR